MSRSLPSPGLPLLALTAAALLASCAHTYLGAGYDTTRRTQGVLAPIMNDDAATGSLVYGIGTSAVSVQAVLSGHHLDLDPSGDRFATASLAGELRARLLHAKHVSLVAHGGPSRAIVFDKEMIEANWGVGYRAGTTLEIALGPFAIWADVHREDLLFSGQTIDGWGTVQGTTIGITVGQ